MRRIRMGYEILAEASVCRFSFDLPPNQDVLEFLVMVKVKLPHGKAHADQRRYRRYHGYYTHDVGAAFELLVCHTVMVKVMRYKSMSECPIISCTRRFTLAIANATISRITCSLSQSRSRGLAAQYRISRVQLSIIF